jgi:hypothetical protein
MKVVISIQLNEGQTDIHTIQVGDCQLLITLTFMMKRKHVSETLNFDSPVMKLIVSECSRVIHIDN